MSEFIEFGAVHNVMRSLVRLSSIDRIVFTEEYDKFYIVELFSHDVSFRPVWESFDSRDLAMQRYEEIAVKLLNIKD